MSYTTRVLITVPTNRGPDANAAMLRILGPRADVGDDANFGPLGAGFSPNAAPVTTHYGACLLMTDSEVVSMEIEFADSAIGGARYEIEPHSNGAVAAVLARTSTNHGRKLVRE